MPLEIERKFLVKSGDFKTSSFGIFIHQGFISIDKERIVRIRIYGKEAFLTVKGLQKGITRSEYEYKIPIADAEEMLEKICLKPTLQKHRYRVEHQGMTWEVDEFHGDNEGLVLAEIELKSEDQPYVKPSWVGEEVTDDPRYYNVNLFRNPYKNWRP